MASYSSIRIWTLYDATGSVNCIKEGSHKTDEAEAACCGAHSSEMISTLSEGVREASQSSDIAPICTLSVRIVRQVHIWWLLKLASGCHI